MGAALVAAGGGALAGASAAVLAVVGALWRNAVALRIEDDEAARAFAGAGGLEAGVAQEEVEHAALAGVHGLEAERLAGVFDLVDGSVGGIADGAGAGCLVAIGVEGDAVVILGLEAQHFGGDVFEGAEQFSIVAEEEIAVRALALDIDVATLEAIGIHGTGTGRDAILQAQTSCGGQEPHQGCDFLCSYS